ncbi:hypothetical protein T11_8911 [Trichinella zimbabwensis]|uniref:Uncharacterized protein n=1 Tax=Trichinella zimbabwensis TaxID=268475 RepID=A0A0V1GUX2_9BILA|nr:hypothetical protein T11_8911 [Trichinella zimbabwensis]
MEESFLWENDSAPDVNRAQFLGKYGSVTDEKWQSWLWENSTNQEKGEAKGKRHWSGEEGAQYVVGKQQKAGERGRTFFGGKFLCSGQKTAELFKGKQLWQGQKACKVIAWKMASRVRIMGGVVVTKQQETGERRRRFCGGKFLCPGQKTGEFLKGKQLCPGQSWLENGTARENNGRSCSDKTAENGENDTARTKWSGLGCVKTLRICTKLYEKQNGTGLEKDVRSMLLENSRKREKEGEDSLAENFSVLDKKRRSCSKENSSGPYKKLAKFLKKRALLLRRERHGTDKMERTCMCEITANGGVCCGKAVESGRKIRQTFFAGKGHETGQKMENGTARLKDCQSLSW